MTAGSQSLPAAAGFSPAAVVDAIVRVAGGPAALHEPRFEGNEWAYVRECLDTGWVSTAGAFVDRFETMLGDYTGAASPVATVNGTAALHICLILAGVEKEDEVITPGLNFIASANAIQYCGAVPHFADIDERTLGLAPDKLADYLDGIAQPADVGCTNLSTGRRIRAVICVHTFGHPAEMDALIEVCARWRLTLIEDATEALGSLYKRRHCGTLAPLAALSFNGNKIITTGGGGAVIAADAADAETAKHLTTTAKVAHPWEFVHDAVGYNYRLPNVNAAIGCAQLERLADTVEKKRALAQRYHRAFDGISGLRCFGEPDHARSNYWLNAILLDRENADGRDEILTLTNEAGLMTRPAWTPMHRLAMFRDCPRADLAAAEDIYARLIALPSSPFLADSGDGTA